MYSPRIAIVVKMYLEASTKNVRVKSFKITSLKIYVCIVTVTAIIVHMKRLQITIILCKPLLQIKAILLHYVIEV